MLRTCIFTLTLITLAGLTIACSGGGNPISPPGDNPDMRIAITRLLPDNEAVDAIVITITRLENGTIALPGRNIQIEASSGSAGMVTDRGDGTYESIWNGVAGGEVTIVATDLDSDPVVQTGLTFLALEFLLAEWDVPIKLKSPISTDGWETAPCLYPNGDRFAFAYITLDLVAYAANVNRPIGEERPGQSWDQTLDIYIAERPAGPSWWTGWSVEHAEVNNFQIGQMNISAPSMTTDGANAFLTVSEFDGDTYEPTTIYKVDPEFLGIPYAIGPPVDMSGLGEDNPYFDSQHGWLYFDTYDLGDPLSKQNIWAAQSFGGDLFDDPVPLTDLNTANIETQPFMHEPEEMLYYASDRGQEDFVLAIWRSQTFGSFTSNPEQVAYGDLALGNPSISYNGEWFCFAYARIDPGGANADIAMCRRIEQ